jgi:hypothetical protein
MGGNSWDCYGASVREDEVRANAEYMAARLREFGWSRLMPAVNRFPSPRVARAGSPVLGTSSNAREIAHPK